ncbi:MAG: hypothetical protein KKC51_00800 [Verrucomicrobia bacterium]|nr:hypothetical protein [Verrucomicrobiota bacterium]
MTTRCFSSTAAGGLSPKIKKSIVHDISPPPLLGEPLRASRPPLWENGRAYRRHRRPVGRYPMKSGELGHCEGLAGIAPHQTRAGSKQLPPLSRRRQPVKTFFVLQASWLSDSIFTDDGKYYLHKLYILYYTSYMYNYHKFMRYFLLAFFLVHTWITVKADTIAFFYALNADLQGLKELARETGQPVALGSRRIQRLSLGPHTIYSVKMGSGSVETAASAQALLSRFRCDWAFSLGPAGALSGNLETGRWYRVDRVIAWQRGTEGSTGMSMSESSTWKTDWGRFPANTLPLLFQSTSTISVASGELFVASTSERDRLSAVTQADAVDMNSFGLALVCADHGVPLFMWKVISDHADESASELFRAFVLAYQGEGGKALAEIIAALPANPRDPASYPAIEKLLREDDQ